MNDKKKLQEMLDRYKRYYVYHDFSAQFTEGDIDWLLGQAEILQKLEDKIITMTTFTTIFAESIMPTNACLNKLSNWRIKWL